jgi:hypothetical protein
MLPVPAARDAEGWMATGAWSRKGHELRGERTDAGNASQQQRMVSSQACKNANTQAVKHTHKQTNKNKPRGKRRNKQTRTHKEAKQAG